MSIYLSKFVRYLFDYDLAQNRNNIISHSKTSEFEIWIFMAYFINFFVQINVFQRKSYINLGYYYKKNMKII